MYVRLVCVQGKGAMVTYWLDSEQEELQPPLAVPVPPVAVLER